MTGAICALVLTMSSPSRSAADVIAFGRDGAARTSGWTFHGARPAWAGLDDRTEAEVVLASLYATPPSGHVNILSLIQATADRHQGNRALRQVGLDADDWQVLLQALVEAESSYNPSAVSPKGAYGLGQLMPETARAFGIDPRNPSQNLDGAARYLLAQLAAFKDIDLALAAYNAGPHRVVEYSGIPPFAETRDYIARNPVRLNRAGGEWLGYLNTLNAGSFSPIAFEQSALPLSHTLSNCRATFDGDVVTLTDAVTGQVKYGALFSMKTYPALTDVTLLDALDLPLDIVLTNSFSPIPNNIMAERIQRIIRQMHASDDAAVSLREQLGQAADDQEAGRIAFGDHHLSIAVYAPDRDTLEPAAAQIKRVGQEIMSVIIRENMALKATYFAQSPGNFGYRARKTPISSINFADFAALHGSVEGRGPDQSPWGQTISILPTVGTSGYRFNFHEAGSPGKEPTVGHTLVLGRTGTGKTLTTAFLAAQAQRVGARLFFFDKDRGLEMAVRALGGRYNEIRAGVPSGLNPLDTEIDERGCAWLSDWLATLLTRNGPLTGEQSRHIQSAVAQNAHAEGSLRRFASFETLFQSLDDDGELQSRVAEWAPGGRYGWVFDEPEQGAGLELASDIIGFDMTEILDMTTERIAVLSYIFRQIERVVEDRRPTIIVLDEAWKLLDDPYFGARLENWLVTLRKMNCVVIMMTQYPSQLRESRVGKTIVETVPTQILFPNDRATISDYDFLRVNAKEAALLVQPTIGQRIALVRSAGDSVFVDADLSALGDLLPILGGGATGEARVPADWRANPDFWRHVI